MIKYFKNISQTTASLLYGLKITFQHFLKARTSRKPIGVEHKDYFEHKEGIFTLQYPSEELPVPDTGRYKLDNEIDDCIVCDKCAKICPVNCIDIEPVRSAEEIGKTSDGTSKRIYAAKFDIDMSKCCFCGLCTVVCPTECLTMTKEYDFSVTDLKAHNFEFGDMSPELIEEKKEAFEIHSAKKQKEKEEKAKAAAAKVDSKPKTGGFKPKMKAQSVESEESTKTPAKPMFKSKVKSAIESSDEVVKPKPKFKPKVKPPAEVGQQDGNTASKPVFKPKVKVKTEEDKELDESKEGEAKKSSKPVFKPKVKAPKAAAIDGEKSKAKKPVFRPKIKSKPVEGKSDNEKKVDSENPESIKADAKKKPVFRPKIKHKKKD